MSSDISRPYRSIGRRSILLGGLASATAALTSCDLSLKPNSGPSKQPKGKEAPPFADAVKNGKLPPVAERLPAKPIVVAAPAVGQYGGTWHSATLGTGDAQWWWRTAGYEPLLRINPDTSEVLANVGESFEFDSAGTTFTVKLVKGIRWSDGEPFSADDIVFWWKSYALDPDLSPAGPPEWMIVDGKPGDVKKIDDLTVAFSFDSPNGLLPLRLADSDGQPVTAMPKHYLEKFHKSFAKDANAQAKKAGLDSWVDLFLARSGESTAFMAKDLPVIKAWSLTTDPGTSDAVVFQRNPYYWKVDQDGSQLPYLDTISMAVMQDVQVILLKATNGELDYHARHFNLPANKPTVARAADRAGYRVTNLVPGSMNVGVIGFNMTTKNAVKREIYRNKDFRIGMSYALDRQQLIDSVVQRQGEPWQAAPRKESRFYDEEMAKQYTEFSLDKANEHLDKAFPKKDGKGNRLGPDGKPIVINFLAATSGGDLESLYLDMQPIMKQQWAKVGVQITTTAMERSLFGVKTGNEVQDALMWTGFGGSDLTLPIDPRWYVPRTTSQSNWAKQWVLWDSTNGADGEEPPESVKEGFTLYTKATGTVDTKKRDDYLKQLLQIAKEDFWVIGTVSTPPSFAVVSKKFMTIPDSQPDAWPFPQPGQLHPETFWLKS